MKRRSAFGSLTLTCLLAILAAFAAPTEAEEVLYKRWAVIASKDSNAVKLADLVSAELSRIRGLQLVERERLDLVRNEAALSAIAGTGNADRIKLGHALGADSLLFLSLEETGAGKEYNSGEPNLHGISRNPALPAHEDRAAKKFLHLAISDCAYGARLQTRYLPFDPLRSEALAKEAAAAVEDTRRQFAAGIRHIIAITPLISKNLAHDYDHLQTGYARLLETAFARTPGLAVLEVEEAQDIARELELGGKELKDRTVPLFIEGEFEMEHVAKDREPKVRLELRVRDGRRIRRAFSHNDQTFAQVAELLAASIPRELLRMVAGEATEILSRQSQRKLLVARADEFAALGDWGHAAALREAELLLAPDDIEQRLAIVADYRAEIERQKNVYRRSIKRYQEGKLDAEWNAACQQQIARWRCCLPHIEYAIRSRALNLREACVVLDNGGFPFSVSFKLPSGHPDFSREMRWKEDFVDRMYAVFSSLDPTIGRGTIRPMVQRIASTRNPARSMSREEQFFDWTNKAIPGIVREECHRAMQAAGGDVADERPAFDRLYRFLTEAVPADAPPLQWMSVALIGDWGTLPSAVLGRSLEARLPAAPVRRFYERLMQSEREMCIFYGRCGLCVLHAWVTPDGQVKKASEPVPSEVLVEADALRKLMEQRGYDKPAGSQAAEFHRMWNIFCTRLSKRHLAPVVKLDPPAPRSPNIDTAPRVTFESLDCLTATWNVWRQCGDSLDVLYSRSEIFIMAQKGVVRRIFQGDATTRIRDVQWDGAHFWVCLAHGPLRILDPEGATVTEVGIDEGLPSLDVCGQYVAGRGRVIAFGMLDERVWFAEILRNKESAKPSFRARLFHKAASVPALNAEKDNDPEEVFIPAQHFEYLAPESARPRLIVARWPRPSNAWPFVDARRPLAIDPESLGVSVFDCTLPFDRNSWNPFSNQDMSVDPRHKRVWTEVADGRSCSAAGRIFTQKNHQVHVSLPPTALQEPWTTKILEAEGGGNAPRVPLSDRSTLFRYGEVIYLAGSDWFRIRPRELQYETLTPTSLSRHHWFRHYAVSAHYGLVAWNDMTPPAILPPRELSKLGAVCRVVLDRQGLPDLALLYPGVPADRREKHHRAIRAVQELGGIVGESWQTDQLNAHLPHDWKGGDAGLNHLADICGLREISLCRTPVTNDGLRHLARCEALNSLIAYETAITRDALEEFRRAKPSRSVYDENGSIQ
jgi:hypothetical protein